MTALGVSCAIGVAMSYFAFLCRAAVSATSFTVIGNVCKILSELAVARTRADLSHTGSHPLPHEAAMG